MSEVLGTQNSIDDRLIEIVSSALDTVGIKEIIYVDDFINRPPLPEEDRFEAIATQLAAAASQNDPRVADFLALGRFNRSAWKAIFDGLPPQRRNELFDSLYDLSMDDDEIDDHAIRAVRILFGKRAKLKNFKTYAREELDSIGSDEKKKSTVFLFDLDASYEGLPKNQGETHLNRALKAGCQFTGLFTHELEPETEQVKLREFISKFPPVREFGHVAIPISKKYFPSNPHPFVKLLIMLLMGHCRDVVIVGVTRSLLNDVEDAVSKIKELDPFDLESIVFQRSRREGLWEPETLVRLFSLYQQEKVKVSLRNSEGISTSLVQMRVLQDLFEEVELNEKQSKEIGKNRGETKPIAKDAQPQGSKPKFWIIQKQERFEEADHLSLYQYPLDLGDIFETTDSEVAKRRFILLAPQCDLMARERSNKRAVEAVLVPLEKDPENIPDIDDFTSMPESQFVPIRYFDDDEDVKKNKYKNTWWASFKKANGVNLLVLDLCVFHPEGQVAYTSKMHGATNITPGWQARLNYVQTRFDNGLKELQSVSSLLVGSNLDISPQKLSLSYLPQLFVTGDFSPRMVLDEVNKVTLVDYGLRRVSRLRTPFSTGLLRDYAAFLTRPAYDMPMA